MNKLGKKELIAIGSSIGLIIAVIVGVTMENKPLDTASLEQSRNIWHWLRRRLKESV